MDAQGDNLLKRLVEQERTLADKVGAAQEEAAELVAEAKRKAEAVLEDARERADRVAREQREAGDREAAAERNEILSATEKDVQAVRERADRRRADATRTVVERVLP